MCTDEISKGVKEAKEVDPEGENVHLDENIMAMLPYGSKILSVMPSGESAWVKTLKVEIQLPSGEVKAVFKKGAPGNRGREMMKGTFESEKAVHSFVPKHVPKPLAWGTYKSIPNMHFYICDFVNMNNNLPDERKFASALAELHKSSMGKSPMGKYGFHVTTHLAFVPNDNSWTDTWTEWFSNAMVRMFIEEERSQGPDDELSSLKASMLDKVIPRLLRPLETKGRSIQPCLVHSDIWPGNVKPRAKHSEIVMFDSCAFWGHNEADLACCRAPRYELGPSYVEEYFKNIEMSDPKEDFDDRFALYAMRYDLLHSALFPGNLEFRTTAMAEMRRLVEKYPDGFESATHLSGSEKRTEWKDGSLEESQRTLIEGDSRTSHLVDHGLYQAQRVGFHDVAAL